MAVLHLSTVLGRLAASHVTHHLLCGLHAMHHTCMCWPNPFWSLPLHQGINSPG
jgi:hypothetical protein